MFDILSLIPSIITKGGLARKAVAVGAYHNHFAPYSVDSNFLNSFHHPNDPRWPRKGDDSPISNTTTKTDLFILQRSHPDFKTIGAGMEAHR